MTIETTQEGSDALRELGNVAFSHAATALSTLVDLRVDVSIPSVVLVEWPLARQDGSHPYIVSFRLAGDQTGVIAVFVQSEQARFLLQRLLDKPVDGHLDQEEGALMEVCNIMAGSALMAMDRMLRTTTLHGTPTFQRRAATTNPRGQRIGLVVEADLTIAGHTARCTMIISPTDATRLLERLGVHKEAHA